MDRPKVCPDFPFEGNTVSNYSIPSRNPGWDTYFCPPNCSQVFLHEIRMPTAEKWLAKMAKLNVYRAKGGAAPHKPLLLLVVLELAEQGHLPLPYLPLSPDLAFRFCTYWRIVAHRRTQRPDVRMAFHHLQKDGFWIALGE